MSNYKITDLGMNMMVEGKLKITPVDPQSQGTSLTQKWEVWYDGMRIAPQQRKIFFMWKGNEVMEIDFSDSLGSKWDATVILSVDGMKGLIPFELRP